MGKPRQMLFITGQPQSVMVLEQPRKRMYWCEHCDESQRSDSWRLSGLLSPIQFSLQGRSEKYMPMNVTSGEKTFQEKETWLKTWGHLADPLLANIIMTYEPPPVSMLSSNDKKLSKSHFYFDILLIFLACVFVLFVNLLYLLLFFSCTKEQVHVPNSHPDFLTIIEEKINKWSRALFF